MKRLFVFLCVLLSISAINAKSIVEPEILSKYQKLGNAIISGDLATVQKLIPSQISVNAIINNNGGTPLIFATYNNKIEIVKYLIKNKANLDAQNYNGWTSLATAAHYGHTNIVKLLLDNDADVNTPNKDGWTPLNMAAILGHTNIVKLLLDNDANVNTTNNNGWTPLVGAAYNATEKNIDNPKKQKPYKDIVKAIIEKDSQSINFQNKYGDTPLNIAAKFGYTKMAQYLIKNGADVNIPNNYGHTPLENAAYNATEKNIDNPKKQKPYKDIVKAIIEKDPQSINFQNKYGATPLKIAAYFGYNKMALYLIKKGADVNIPNNNGWNPLTIAAYNATEKNIDNPKKQKPYKDIVNTIILEDPQSINFQNKYGATPLNIATYFEYNKMALYLIKKGADVNIPDNNGNTPLNNAIYYGYTDMVKLLLTHNADLNKSVYYNNTTMKLLEFAQYRFKQTKNKAYKEIIKLLQQHTKH